MHGNRLRLLRPSPGYMDHWPDADLNLLPYLTVYFTKKKDNINVIPALWESYSNRSNWQKSLQS